MVLCPVENEDIGDNHALRVREPWRKIEFEVRLESVVWEPFGDI